MNLKEYDKLRIKRDKKDFEGRNKGLNKWLFRISWIGNIGSIFFAYFLIYPALYKAISIHLFEGMWSMILANFTTVLILAIFELIKRYVVKNFSLEYFENNKKINAAITGLFSVTLLVIALSFYVSISGSKNLATTSGKVNIIIENNTNTEIDSVNKKYEDKMSPYVKDNENLRKLNNDLRQKLIETPVTYSNIRNGYQANIDKNLEVIKTNENVIDIMKGELDNAINRLNKTLIDKKENNKNADIGIIFLFIVLTIVDEFIIILGIYFREYYEHKLYENNKQKFDKIYLRKDRYRALLSFCYNNGKANPGDKVISGLELKAILAEKASINNYNKLVDEFLFDMDRLNIFVTNGKRRHIAATYPEAQEILENFDDAFRIIENMK